MATNGGYRVNEDGSVTRIDNGGSNNIGNNRPNNNSGGDSDNSGCIWGIIIAVIGVIIAIANSGSSDSSNNDYDLAEAVEVVEVEDVPVIEEVYKPATTYLRVSDEDIYISGEGGSREISIYTDGNWYVSVDVANWGHLSKHSDSITLRVDPNTSSSSRTDYFIIKSGSYTKRININQSGNTSPRAEIERIWVDHSVYQDGVKGMMIHVKFTVDNMNGKTIYAYALFYYGDNVTPLHDAYGNNLSFSSYGTPNYDGSRFNDFKIFIPYSGLNMQQGAGSVDLSFDISIRTSSGTELDRDNNTQFTFIQS